MVDLLALQCLFREARQLGILVRLERVLNHAAYRQNDFGELGTLYLG